MNSIGINSKGYINSIINYKKGICPVAEELNDKTFFGIEMCLYEYNDKNIEELINAFQKVFENLDEVD